MFADRPVGGYGADNFQREYFLRGNGDQQPRYPHSLEVRVLAQTGLVGALLLGGALVAGFLAASAALRGRRDLAAAVAAGALLSFAYFPRPRIGRLVLGVRWPRGHRLRGAGAGDGTW